MNAPSTGDDAQPRAGGRPQGPMHYGAEPIGPASVAAKLRRDAGSGPKSGERTYPPALHPYDATGDGPALAATRALLTVRSRAEAAGVLRTVIDDMGGCVVPARLAGPEAVPVDVSLGVGEPMVVVVLDPLGLASLRLARHLPLLVEDALSAARRCENNQRRRFRDFHRSAPGDAVCALGLDDLDLLDDSLGHATRIQTVHALGEVLRAGIRREDFVGRCGDDEFIVVLALTSSQVACERMTKLSVDWAQCGHGPAVFVGVAAVGQRGADIASRAAVAALYRAKRLATGSVQLATPNDYLIAKAGL